MTQDKKKKVAAAALIISIICSANACKLAMVNVITGRIK